MGATHTNSFTDAMFCAVNKGFLRGMYLRVENFRVDTTEREFKLISKKQKEIIRFFARPLPGCCGVLVVSYLRPGNAEKDPEKVFAATLQLIVKAAGDAKFGTVQLTQVGNSTGYNALRDELHILPTYTFTNYKTGNTVGVFFLGTEAPPPEPKGTRFDGE